MENQEQEINLQDLFYLLLSKLPFIILLAVLGLISGFAFAKLALPVKYTSSISIYVNNANDVAEQDNKAEAADIAASKALANTYIVILQDDIVYEEVSDYLIEDYELNDLNKLFDISYSEGEPYITPGQIKSMVNIQTVNDTEVIQITATTENPELSADICTYVSKVAPDLIKNVTKAGSVETIGNAKVPKNPSFPNVKRITAIGGLLGMVIAVAIVIISDLLDNRIKTAEDFKKRFDKVPVLAEIPDLNESGKGGSR